MSKYVFFPGIVTMAFAVFSGSFVTANSAEFESSIERIEARDGRKTLVGFAFLRSVTAPARIQVFLDRPRNARGTLIATFEAKLQRSDVQAALSSPTAFSGFRWEIPGNLANSGRRIYVYRDRSQELLKSPIAESDGSIVLTDTSIPLGSLERVTTLGTDQIATGWAWFPGIEPGSIRVDLYADNLPGSGGIFVGSTMLSEPRPDLADKLGLPDSKLGFGIPVPPRFRCSGRRLYAFAVDPNERVKKLAFGPSGGPEPLRIPYDASLADGFGVERELSWSPGIVSPRRVRALSQSPWIQADTFEDETGGQAGGNGFWLVSTSMETAQFTPVRPQRSMDALLPGDPIFRLTASRADIDRWAFQLNVDKRSGRTIDGIATNPTTLFGGVNDSFDVNPPSGGMPSVGENVVVELEYRVPDRRTWNVPGLEAPRARLSLGATTRFSRAGSGEFVRVTNYTEVNLDRTASFDLCPTSGNANRNLKLPPGVPLNASDPLGIYDMRHYWRSDLTNSVTSSGGELVYYDRRAISNLIRESRTSDGWTRLRIPLSYLISSYGWSRNPYDWDSVEIAGIYFGIEIWGKGVMAAEIRDYRAYATHEAVAGVNVAP